MTADNDLAKHPEEVLAEREEMLNEIVGLTERNAVLEREVDDARWERAAWRKLEAERVRAAELEEANAELSAELSRLVAEGTGGGP